MQLLHICHSTDQSCKMPYKNNLKERVKEGDLIISTTGLDRFNKEEEIGISFDLSHVCLFDIDNGDSIL